MLAFGLPTVPADASVYALQVADRWYLLRAQSAAAAGLYALAAKLATVVFVAVRGFQYAWPPLAYSIEDDAIAARLYAIVTTYYVLATGAVVAGVALLGRWAVRLLLHHGSGTPPGAGPPEPAGRARSRPAHTRRVPGEPAHTACGRSRPGWYSSGGEPQRSARGDAAAPGDRGGGRRLAPRIQSLAR